MNAPIAPALFAAAAAATDVASLLPHELPDALDRFTGLRVLSLDCFDTLLWRDCHAPRDIFARLKPTTPLQRGWAETQARRIADSAGEDVAGLIDRIFVSSAHGKAKAGGLYADVLRKLSAAPHQILHIGDNHGADVGGVAPFGVHTLHLKQFGEATVQRLRFEAAVSAMLHPLDSGEIAAQQPHRATCALAEPQLADTAGHFGHSVLGPVLAGYEIWLRAEAEALTARHGGRVHWLFMMRDGWLPMQVHAALDGTRDGQAAHAVEISRFTAIGASFAQDIQVQRFVERELGMLPQALARQLLIPEAEIDKLIGDHTPEAASLALLAECRKAECKRAVVKASRALAKRLVEHVRATVNPEPGDTLMLVDLGYNGTVQNHIDALLARELKVHVAGRYLLLREMDHSGLDKTGFLGSDHYDPPTLEALCANVAVLEQVCTTQMGSVIDYTETGAPVRRANEIGAEQTLVRGRVQAGCLRFASACTTTTMRRESADEVGLWRRGAAAVLGRLMYLPNLAELAVLERFEHDVNLGTEAKVALFDPQIAARGLRQRGLFHLKASERMYLPAELAGQGLPSRLTLLAAKRFGLPLTFTDFSDATIDLPVIFADQSGATAQFVTAQATHEGWFMAAIPIGEARFTAAIQFGALYDWLQLDSLNFVAMNDLLSDDPLAAERQVPAAPIADGIEQVAPGLLRCADANGLLLVPPPVQEQAFSKAQASLLLVAVFRPIAPRAQTIECAA